MTFIEKSGANKKSLIQKELTMVQLPRSFLGRVAVCILKILRECGVTQTFTRLFVHQAQILYTALHTPQLAIIMVSNLLGSKRDSACIEKDFVLF